MLKLLRHKNVSKMVLWGILILILPAFVIWGAGSLSKERQKGPKFVGTIDGKKITFDRFAESVSGVRCQIFTNFFDNQKVLNELMKNQPLIGKVAWDRLIMLNEARRLKIKADDKDVVAYIRSHPLFMRNGSFDPELYSYILRNNLGLDPRSFEEIVRENVVMQKLSASMTKDVTTSDEEVISYFRADTCKFRIAYAILAEGSKAKDAEDIYKKLSETVGKDGKTFEAACAEAGLKLQETPLFSKTDYIEGLGEAMPVAAMAGGIARDGISGPVMTRKGVMIFKLLEISGFDQVKLDTTKSEYAKRALEMKKNIALEAWLRELEGKNTLNIDLNEYEKYYR